MKSTKVIDISTCDDCGSDQCYFPCVGCGRDVCFDCEKLRGTRYSEHATTGASGSIYFCPVCDANPPEHVRKLHIVGVAIKRLAESNESFHEEFRRQEAGLKEQFVALEKQLKEKSGD